MPKKLTEHNITWGHVTSTIFAQALTSTRMWLVANRMRNIAITYHCQHALGFNSASLSAATWRHITWSKLDQHWCRQWRVAWRYYLNQCWLNILGHTSDAIRRKKVKTFILDMNSTIVISHPTQLLFLISHEPMLILISYCMLRWASVFYKNKNCQTSEVCLWTGGLLVSKPELGVVANVS